MPVICHDAEMRIEPVSIKQIETKQIETVLCDLDGVVWLAHEPIPGSVEAIAALRAAGRRVVFVTNNSAAMIAEHEASLEAIGIPADGDVISSSVAAALLVQPGERVLVTGGPGIVEAVEASGAIAVLNDGTVDGRNGGFDAVLVGLHRDFDYQRLAAAAAAIHSGARLVGTNSDSTYPTPRGLEPGGGSILAAVATAGNAVPTIAGKPHAPMAQAIARHLSTDNAPFDPATAVMVGDRPETDGLMAARIGCRFALVRSGVIGPADDLASLDELVIDFDLLDLGALAALLLG
ncbi:MAG: HAD superfamily hydrolase (TIGR01450 family) [Candidatus Azotimanducaceae bacterium]|jgi:HAD superfamily hydrolase (TIGR01450 family)